MCIRIVKDACQKRKDASQKKIKRRLSKKKKDASQKKMPLRNEDESYKRKLIVHQNSERN